MGLIRFILFVLFFYLIYFLVKYLFIRPFKEGISGKDKKRNPQNPFSKRKEGDVSISFDPRDDDKAHHEVGEYVEYEEVKEEKDSK